ncbi:MAG TPA: 30S ribosomal protein S11 [Candidatus Nanoarchaeia archaeon]
MAKAKKQATKDLSVGKIYISATFNNTLITITDAKGDTVAWSSSGAMGFKGARKSTPYAATTAVETAVKKATAAGVSNVEVYIKGPGSGREAAIRALRGSGLNIKVIADVTPIPHNGPRPRKKRRV